MEAEQKSFWNRLFSGPVGAGASRSQKMRLLRRGGRPWLLLPEQARAAARVLDLYPAQTAKARLARALVRTSLLAGMPFGTERLMVSFNPEAGFVGFLNGLAGTPMGGLPPLGVLAGNAATPGQRFILLLFRPDGQPTAVVKAGLTDRARALIEREETFLAAVPTGRQGIPPLRGRFAEPGLRAFALDFIAGNSPPVEETAKVAGLLSDWLVPQSEIALGAMRAWQELAGVCAGEPLFTTLAKALAERVVHPALTHGDLAPWNIKVLPSGEWAVLDWERGELSGVPAWDWFHFVLQPALLVARESTAQLLARSQGLCASAEFQRYAQASGIAGAERQVLLAYLLHHVRVIRPSEGLAQSQALLEALASQTF